MRELKKKKKLKFKRAKN